MKTRSLGRHLGAGLRNSSVYASMFVAATIIGASSTAVAQSTFGIYTDTTPYEGNITPGLDSEIYVWDPTTSGGSEAPLEGPNVMSFTVAGNTWFGGGIASNSPLDLSAYADGTLHFSVKLPADKGFRIGITDTYTNQNWVDFPAGSEQYGMTRDGEWTTVSLPVSDLRGTAIAMQSLEYPIAWLSLDPVSTTDFEISFDDIYFTDGAVADSDGDGVADPEDICPDTLPGVDVDELGCEIPTYNEVTLTNGLLVGGPDSLFPGQTLFANRRGDGTECNEKCAEHFTPVLVEDGEASDAEGLGLISLEDGSEQATFNGRPLYFGANEKSKRKGKHHRKHSFIAAKVDVLNTLDADKDGANDGTDLCPHSDRHTEIDAFGCPIPGDTYMEISELDGNYVGGPDSIKPGHTLYTLGDSESCEKHKCKKRHGLYIPLIVKDGEANTGVGLGTVEAHKGKLQATLNDEPLFFYKKDYSAGEINGAQNGYALATAPEGPGNGWELVWSDEFNGSEIDSTSWGFEENCWGGGNGEQQCYTNRTDNAFVNSGLLNIVAQREDFTGVNDSNGEGDSLTTLPYTSARLRTKYLNEWTFGRFEIRAKLPSGQGTWPAIWMLPTDSPYGGWAAGGEIDIVEAVNLKVDGENRLHGTLHYGRNWPGNVSSGEDYTLPSDANPADGFHTYSVEWEQDEIRWYVDDVHYATQTSDGWYSQPLVDGELTDAPHGAPFDDAQQFHLLLNLAVGGSWAGNTNQGGIDESVFPQTLQVDYVRVYQCSENPTTGQGCATIGPDAVFNPGNSRPDIGPADDTFAQPPLFVMYDEALAEGLEFGAYDPDGNVSWAFPAGLDGLGLQVIKTGATGNLYFNLPNGLADLSAWEESGELVFDILVNSIDEGAELSVKIDSGWPNVSDTSVSLPPVGEWGEFRISVAELLANGNSLAAGIADLSSILNIFVIDSNGAMDIVFDNIRLELGEGGSGPVAPSGEPIDVYADAVSGSWNLWDCCGGASIAEVADTDSARGTVAEFSFNANPTVAGFYQNTGFDANAYAGGLLEFDLFLAQAPLDATAEFRLKIEGADASQFAEVVLNESLEGHTAALGEWRHFTFDLDTLAATSSWSLDNLRLILIFPDWGKGDGTIFRLDNVRVTAPQPSTLPLYINEAGDGWNLWDCCGGAAITELTDSDPAHDSVVEFAFNANPTVAGLYRNTGIDVSGFAGGTLEFDLFLDTAPIDPTAEFRLKIEGPDGSFFVEVLLSESQEGTAPVLGAWQHFTFDLDTLDAQGSWNLDNLKIVMIFPDWGKGDGTAFRLDNLEINMP